MVTRKSPEEASAFYAEILVRTLMDAAEFCCLGPSSVKYDIRTIRERTKAEGLGFLTKSLPSLGKCFDKALGSDKSFADLSFEWNLKGFQTSKKTGLPVFLGSFWELIFDDCSKAMELDGFERAQQVNAVRAVRQVCYCLYKLGVPYAPELEAQVIESFKQTDRELPEEDSMVSLSPTTAAALNGARLLILDLLMDFDPLAIVPAHGPGAVAGGERNWEKMNFSRYYASVDEVYPYSDFFFYNYSHLCDELDTLELLTEHPAPVAKLALVPKDSRGPRIISMEPLEIQWLQHGLGEALRRKMEAPKAITSGYVNFTDQTLNRGLAQHASDGSMKLDTLDMKDASDRVSLWLVKQLFPEHIFRHLKALRSVATQLPDGDCFELRKYAPMGSALCFPVEALVFWALAVGSVQTIRSFSDMKSLPPVFVYGDDMILRHGDYVRVAPVFDELHLKFNEDKCCTGRFFRESCGLDAFRCEDVSPTRIKALWRQQLSPAAKLSYVSYVNSFREKGWPRTSEFLEAACQEKFGPVPICKSGGRFSFAFTHASWTTDEVEAYLRKHFTIRYNRKWQRTEVHVPLPYAHSFERGRPDWSEMLRLHRTWGSSSPFGNGGSHLGACSYTVPHTVKMRGSWCDLLDYTS